jgi:hypothetical protein
MNERQKKIVTDALRMLALGAKRGIRMVNDDATPQQITAHARDLEELARGIRDNFEKHVGAAVVLDKVARAKAAR